MSIELDATAELAAVDVTASAATPARRGGAEPALEAGDLLAHFRIDRRLGAGGMGEVWLATDLALDRPVAIKFLPPEVARDPARRERLFREARAQARIQHPNVCHIYYVGEERGLVFFAMEYVAGESLAERLARGPIPAGEAIELVRMAALGLREAHRHGFTHRDVKPSNLMVDAHGQVKVVDFGLVTRGETAEVGDGAVDVTQTALVGTPLYMAPEQGRGEAVDFRADVYALGATLHHLVAGAPPFQGKTAADLMTQHADAPRPALPAAAGGRRKVAPVERLLAHMMAKLPTARCASYDALLGELERISPARTRPVGFFARGAAAVIDLLVVGLAAALVTAILPGRLPDNLAFIALWPLYAVGCHARWGITVGRALFDIEVVSIETGRPPSPGAALVRWLVETVPMLVGVFISSAAGAAGHTVLSQFGLAVAAAGCLYAFVALGVTALRASDKRTLWDRASGTMVRYQRGSA